MILTRMMCICMYSKCHRDAEEGFNTCAFCGFENFKRIPFCNLCGEQIVVLPQPTTEGQQDGGISRSPAGAAATKADAEAAAAVVAAVVSGGAVTTQRQKRARYTSQMIPSTDVLYWKLAQADD